MLRLSVLLVPFLSSIPGRAAPVAAEFTVPGSSVAVRLLPLGPHGSYRLSFDGGRTWTRLEPVHPYLHLRYARFDPLAATPPVPPVLRAHPDGRLFLVQFKTQSTEAYRRVLEGLGVELHAYMPDQAFLVRMSPGLVPAVSRLPFVRWVGPYHPAYRLSESIRGEILRGDEPPARRYDISMVDRRRDKQALVRGLKALGAEVVNATEGHVLVEAILDGRQLLAAAALDTVQFIDPWSPPEEDMDNARIYGGANSLEPKGPLGGHTGKGIRGHIMEGIYSTHREFGATLYRSTPIAIADARASGHGTATFGIVFAKGVTAKARGMLPDGQGYYTHYYYVYNNGNRYNLVKTLKNTYHVMFQTASWGYARTIYYTNRSAEMDTIIFDHDIPITQSQSNAGGPPSRPQAWAKNIISVGGIRHYNTLTPTDDRWARAGSTGPARDGRIKPDLCAYYDYIYTTGYSSTSYTAYFGGTSGATPIVAGHVGLTIEMFTDGYFGHKGKRGDWRNRHLYLPHFTTVKALLINHASQYPFSGTTHDLTRTHQGWGWPNVWRMYSNRDTMLLVDENDVLRNRGRRSYWVFVPPGRTELKATMVCAEPAANPAASKTALNDLDLTLTAPDGRTVYHGNYGLTAANYSPAGGVKNSVDPVECVFVQKPTAGVWRVDVDAAAVNVDTHKETPGVDADYALVVTGPAGMRDRSGPTLTLTSKGQGDLTITPANLPQGWTEGWTLLSLTTKNRPYGHGNFFGLELDAVTIAVLSSPAGFGNPGHFKATANPNLYPNKAFTVPPGSLSLLKGWDLDGVLLLAGPNGFVGVSNVARVRL